MKTDDDLILFLTRTLRELEPAVRPDVVGRLEERMRSHFGGERVYVAKPADRRVALRQARVLARLRTGESVRDVARAMSLSVRTVYRIKLRLPER
ncbi:MAG TPA: helix-turn-helix domain-containing protein [Myxococcota bacterium]|nr:helix-turn-helix domain-containing protein [Myxococcota bacterium]